VGGACGKHGRAEKIVQGFGAESPNEREHSEARGVDGRVGSVWILGRLAAGYAVDLSV
jgi:hypothetical protein